jgi:hypothetical protein
MFILKGKGPKVWQKESGGGTHKSECGDVGLMRDDGPLRGVAFGIKAAKHVA